MAAINSFAPGRKSPGPRSGTSQACVERPTRFNCIAKHREKAIPNLRSRYSGSLAALYFPHWQESFAMISAALTLLMVVGLLIGSTFMSRTAARVFADLGLEYTLPFIDKNIELARNS